jgi:hypothetical protein
VHVVEHDHEVLGHRGEQLVAEIGHHVVGRPLEVEAGVEAGKALRDTGGDVGHQAPGVEDPAVARAPRPGPRLVRDHLGEQRRLAVARAGDDGDQPSFEPAPHGLGEPRPCHAPRR